jgi:hypothetical protein
MARPVVLQTVELDGMSAEGGQGTLYGEAAGRCRIEAIYYGEGGRVKFEFEFGPSLRWALKKEYRYKVPYYIPPDERRVTSVRTTVLNSAEGRRILPAEFQTHKGYFDARQLAKCSESRS